MLSNEERKAIEQAISNIARGVDIESAMLILEKCALDGLIITEGRINIFKIAVRQIVEFLKEYKDKSYLEVVREKVKANELIEKQSKEIEEYKKQLDLDNECEIALNNKVMDLEKEIEELKEDRKSYAEEYIHNNPWLYKQLNENYILRVESEQKERKAYIKGTNDAHELCNKKWKNKIKAKIEEKFLEAKGLHERGVQPQAQYTMKLLRDLEKSLLEKE